MLFRSPRFTHISPILRSFHWLKIDQRIQYKVISLTYKTLQSQKPSYLYNLLNIQTNTPTRSSTSVTLQRPTVNSRLKITDRSFTHHAPVLWNSLPRDLRQPATHSSHTDVSCSTAQLALPAPQFLSRLKTHLFHKSFPTYSLLFPLLASHLWFISDLA